MDIDRNTRLARAMATMLLAFWAWACLDVASGAVLNFDFSHDPLHHTPPGFKSCVTGQGHPGDWEIILAGVPPALPRLTPMAPKLVQRAVLAQLSRDPTDEHFPLLIYEKTTFGDFTLTTRFETVKGKAEQMAGIAFRIQDPTNYYVVRASSLGHTFRFYKVVNGIRGSLIGPDLKIPRGVWHTLKVQCTGNHIRCSLDGKQAIPTITDYTFTRGKIGFWTKSDSVSYFVDTQITYQPLVTLAQRLVKEMVHRYPRVVGLKIYATGKQSHRLQIVASTNPKEIGEPAPKEVIDTVKRDVVYYGKNRKIVTVTLALRDRNGDPVAALRVVMHSFPGQTQENAIVRSRPIAKAMESRFLNAKDLTE